MKKAMNRFVLDCMKALNPVLLTVPVIAAWFCWYAGRLPRAFYFWGDWFVVFLFFAMYVAFGRVYGAFQISFSKIFEVVYSQGLAAFVSDCFLYLITLLLMRRFPNPLPLLLAFVVQMVLSTAWTALTHKWYFSTFPARKSAVVYDMRRGMEFLVDEYGLNKKFDIQHVMSADECLHNLDLLDGLEAVFLSGVHSRDRNIILKYCIAHDIRVYLVPRIGDVIMSGAEKIHLFHLPMLQVERYNPSMVYLLVKRLIDLVVSGVALVVFSPIFLVTAAAVKITDGGPVFYKQERLTKSGKRFYIHKFRSMRVDAEKDGVARLSTGEQDDRITPVGRFIRKVRIDELPQLIDILAGNLTIVGPRPERPEIADEYAKEMPEFGLRLQAKAGLTGYAQVYGKYNTTPYDKLQMDLMYIAHPSIIEDLRIMFATVKILFMPESTEGIAVGNVTAIEEHEEKRDDKVAV